MDANDLLHWATQLLASDQQVRLRGAVSRAYYGAYHAAREFVEQCGVAVPNADVHDKLYWCLHNAGDVSLVEAGPRLATLRRQRNKADYDLAATSFQDRRHVRVLVERAVSLFNQLRAISGDATPAPVQQSVQAYASKVLKWPIA